MKYLWKEKENANTGYLQGQRSCMTVRQDKEITYYSMPLYAFYILNHKRNLYIFPPLGHICFSLCCLYEEMDREELPLPTPATPSTPQTLFFAKENPSF